MVSLGVLSGGGLLAIVGLWAGGGSLAYEQAKNAWSFLVDDAPMTPTELALERFDFAGLQPSNPKVSSLDEGDLVSFLIESRGCLGYHTVYRLDMQGPAPPSVSVHRLSVEHPREETTLRHFSLSESDTSRLDAALSFYRDLGQSKWFCTTEVDIAVEWRIAGHSSSETFVDHSCLLTYENPYALAPGLLALKHRGAP